MGMRRSYQPQGYGRLVTGGMGGTIMHVTNTNDSGSGSLRDALLRPERREIRIMVKGLLTLQSQIIVRNPNFTLTGRYAPAPGFCVRGHETAFGSGLILITSYNFIVEHMRFRSGATNVVGGTGDRESFGCFQSRRGLIRNCSMSWGVDANLDCPTSNEITIERCLIAQGLNYSNHSEGPHSTGGRVHTSISFRENVLAFNSFRNTLTTPATTDTYEYINNLVYDWEVEALRVGNNRCNAIGNVFIAGADTQTARFPIVATHSTETEWLYVEDNLDTYKRTLEADPEWDIVGGGGGSYSSPQSATHQKLTPWVGSDSVSFRRAAELEAYLLPIVGATRPVRDAVDTSIISKIAGRTGSMINAVESGEVTVGLGSAASPGQEPRPTPSYGTWPTYT